MIGHSGAFSSANKPSFFSIRCALNNAVLMGSA